MHRYRRGLVSNPGMPEFFRLYFRNCISCLFNLSSLHFMLPNFQTSRPVLVITHSLQLLILKVCFASRRYTLSILQTMALVLKVSDSAKDD